MQLQVEASGRVSELFGNDPDDAGIVSYCDVSGQADAEPAMHAGQAFVERR